MNTDLFLNVISYIMPSFIVLGIINRIKKIDILESLSLFFVISIALNLLNLGLINFLFRIDNATFIQYNLISLLISIPLVLFFIINYKKIDFKRKVTKKKLDLVGYIIIFFSIILLSYSLYYLYFFDFYEFDNVLYTFLSPVDGVGIEAYTHGLFFIIPMFIFLLVVFLIPIFERGEKVFLKIKKKKIQLLPIKFFVEHKVIYSIVVFLVAVIYCMNFFFVFNYILSLTKTSTIYEEHFVETSKANIIFPKKKRNLIYIMVESLETTTLSTQNGGHFKNSITPELEEIAINNINFSHNGQIGGFTTPQTCGWTIASILCQTGGIPLKTTLNSVYSDTLIPNTKTMWDVLYHNGYNLKVIMGSSSIFAKTNTFFNHHNVDDIVDYQEIVKRENLPKNYKRWWGVEDRKLLKRAKEEIKDLASKDKPFATIISTMDTHFPDGYQDPKCSKKHNDKYLNSYSCSSNMIGEFIEWIKNEPYYKDTVIVLVGDHLSMQKKTFEHAPKEERYVYNAFINTNLSNNNSKNRKFTSFDIYPTILGSLGVKIDGDKLGFGTNLFSGEKTLIETIGYEKFEKNIYLNSKYNDTLYE